MVVGFREMEHAANVELTAGPEYFIELNERFKTHRKDIGAALAHEVAHVWLHRLDLSFPGTRDNEILTDTATTYLGAGWLLLDAYREHGPFSQKLGYLTPEEFGYVLAQRAQVFDEDPAPWFTSPQAYDAYTAGQATGPPGGPRGHRWPPPAGPRGTATPRTAARPGSPGPAPRRRPRATVTPSKGRGRSGCRSRAPPATSASAYRSEAVCRRVAACARPCWTATPDRTARRVHGQPALE